MIVCIVRVLLSILWLLSYTPLWATPPNEHHIEVKKNKKQRVQIKNQHISITDVLQENNIYIQQNGDLHQGFKPSIRASSAQNQGVELQGIPIQNARSQSFDFSLLPLSLFQSLEIEKGSNSALYGSGYQSGKISLQIDDQIAGKHIKFKTQGASTRIFEQSIQVKNTTLTEGYQLGLSYTFGDNAFLYQNPLGINERRENNAQNRIAQLSHWHKQGKFGEISVFGGFSLLDRQEAPLENQLSANRFSKHQFYLFGINYLLPFEQSEWRIKAYGNVYNYAFTDPLPTWQNNKQNTFKLNDQRAGTMVEGHIPVIKDLSFKLKLQYEWLQATGSFFNQSLSHRKQWIQASGFQYQIKNIQISTYLRLDYLKQRGLIAVPYTELKWEIHTQLAMQSRMGKAFRDAGFDELYMNAVGVVPNPNLKLEEGQWLDLSLLWASKENKAHVSLTYFYQQYDKMIIYIPLDPYRIQAQDRFKTQMQGLELQVNLELPIHPNYKLKFQHQSSLIHHHFTSSPYTPIPLKPFAYAFTRFSLDQSKEKYQFFIQYFYRSSLSADRFNLRHLPNIHRIDLGINKIYQAFELSFLIRNLLDTPMYDVILRPLPAISFWITASYTIQ